MHLIIAICDNICAFVYVGRCIVTHNRKKRMKCITPQMPLPSQHCTKITVSPSSNSSNLEKYAYQFPSNKRNMSQSIYGQSNSKCKMQNIQVKTSKIKTRMTLEFNSKNRLTELKANYQLNVIIFLEIRLNNLKKKKLLSAKSSTLSHLSLLLFFHAISSISKALV